MADPIKGKEAKQTAQYGPGHANAHCSICKHFEKPDACEIVAGKISPSAWCVHFYGRDRTKR